MQASSRHVRRCLHHSTRWCLVAFYALACMRALVPGLCASIRDAAATAPTPVAMSEARSCCRVPGPGSPEAPLPSPASDSGCAFCHLVQAFSNPPLTVDVQLPFVLVAPASLPEKPRPALAYARVLPPLRAPPA